MYLRGYVENWIVILDSGGSGLFDFPFSTLSMINEFFSINYTSSLHKMFILNPSFIFNSSWKLIESNILYLCRNYTSRNSSKNKFFKIY
jgi:hypothetical protein